MNTLQERLRAMAEDVASALTWCAEAADRIAADALRTLGELLALQDADAERDRWVRSQRHYAVLETLGYTYAQIEHRSNKQNEAKMDAAIDAARSKT